MKNLRISWASAVLISASAILLCGSLAVNHFGTYSKANHHPTLVADGYPLPPFPPAAANNTLVADGYPLPPFPPALANTQLVADGYPLPPFPPAANSTLVADGYPLPPFPPETRVTRGMVS